MKVTMDAAGRLVIPKAIRAEVGIGPNTELEIRARGAIIELRPVTRVVVLESRGSIVVAVPAEEGPLLRQSEADAVRDDVRRRGTGVDEP